MLQRDRIVKLLAPHVMAYRKSEASSDRMKRLREIALAMLNYESANRKLPGAGFGGTAESPNLSWRVKMLPYLGENALYRQFHLDEPWDSEHNLPLAKKMPKAFTDSAIGSGANNKLGKTVFQVPVGKQMLFNGSKQPSLGLVSDGTSNTILAVTVAQKNAAVWSQPDDWEIDLENPKSELGEEGREKFEAVLLDSSTHTISLKIEDETLRRLTIPNDGQVIWDY